MGEAPRRHADDAAAEEIDALRSLGDPVSLREVEQVYLPVSRLLSFYVTATHGLFHATQHFLGTNDAKVPFIIGIGGSVAVGKSTTARVLMELLKRWPSAPKVDLVTTDGFLFPNAVLKAEGLMERKGFPESYDVGALLAFLTDIKAGRPKVRRPSIRTSPTTSCRARRLSSTGPTSSSSKG